MYQIVLVITLAFLTWTPLTAQTAEATVYGGLSQIGDNDLGEVGFAGVPLEMKKGFKAGARLTLNGSQFFGHELSYGYERHDLEVGGQKESQANVQQFYYDFVVHFAPRSVSVRPFVLAGGGFSSFSAREEGIFVDGAGETKPGVNFGGGLKVKLSPRFGLRFDVRDHLTEKPNFLDLAGVSGRLHSLEYSAGFSLLF